tara:strand:+ start:56 stop:895 length:840 start_codon:yes stop_codon:yes gene_type:complete
MRSFIIYLFILSGFLLSCAKEESTVEVIEKKEIDIQMIDAYNEGMRALDEQDGLTAAKKFTEAELLFPQSAWAPKSSLMAAYSYFSSAYYADTIYEIERFLKTYPNHPRTDYAYYLLAVTYYNSIVDETKDLGSILKSKEYFQFIINNFPETEYAVDAVFKLELINEVLASKEMYLARYYFDKQKWIPAINRFKLVVEKYDDSVFIEEALHRLVEIHYKIGLEDEAKKYAYLLGYNYQSSEWYENTYKVFNKKYEPTRKKIKNNTKKKSLIEKIKTKIF